MARFHFAPVTDSAIAAILAWRYDPPYEAYNASADGPGGSDLAAELRDPRSPYFAAWLTDEESAVERAPDGFFAFGSACEIGTEPDAPAEPHLRRADGSITVGLGLRPGLTGGGRGLAYVLAGLSLARERYKPPAFRLFVYAWNQRAVRVYWRAGFSEIGRDGKPGPDGSPMFIEMTRPA